jgi:hypothetical protein
VDSLLCNGAGVRLKNKSGSTPLHLAVQNTGKGGLFDLFPLKTPAMQVEADDLIR